MSIKEFSYPVEVALVLGNFVASGFNCWAFSRAIRRRRTLPRLLVYCSSANAAMAVFSFWYACYLATQWGLV